MHENSHCFAAIVAAAISVLATESNAALIYSTGFEPPTYTTGSLSGQDGWTGFASVQSTSAASGNQALQIHYTGSTFAPATHLLATPTAGQIITIEADLRIHYPMQAQGDGVAVLTVVGDSGTIGRFGYILGHYRFGNMTFNVYGDPLAPNDTWHHFVFEMNFPMQTISATFNGTSLGTLPIINAVAPTTLSSIRISANQASFPLDAYFDNITITSIPEPGSLALLGLALPVVVRRRRM